MSNLNPLLERNQTFAETGSHKQLAPIPKYPLVVLTCMDQRVDPAHILGVDLGDALVLRNVGGRVTDAVIADVTFVTLLARNMLGDKAPTFEVAIIHHTECGARFLSDDNFRQSLADRIGANERELAAQAVTDPTLSVVSDVKALLASPAGAEGVSVSGHVYDMTTGRVTTVAASVNAAVKESAASERH
jgi:carbonic anhydrase